MSSGAINKYSIDLVFVIDTTGSMGSVIGEVKVLVQGFSDRLRTVMTKEGKDMQDLWVRIVTFRDLGEEGPRAISASHFYELPKQEDALHEFVGGLSPAGGADEAESGLEALWLAMRSPWRNVLRSRHIIVMLTDACAHDLGKYEYPKDLFQDAVMPPENLHEMKKYWGIYPDSGVMNTQARRLIIFAPDATPWNEIGERWEQTVMINSRAGEGLIETELDVILRTIAKSV